MELDSNEVLLNQIIEAFTVITGNPEAFRDWANEPNPELGGKTPAELFDSNQGKYLLKKLEEFINNGGI